MKQFTLAEQTALFFSGWRTMDNLYDQYAKSVGLTYLSVNVLRAIYETPENCTQKMLSEQVYLPKQSVNVIIRSFLDQGLIEMKEIATDRRNKAIRLTESGQQYADKVIGSLIQAEEWVIGQLSYEQRQDMIGLVDKIGIALQESIEAI